MKSYRVNTFIKLYALVDANVVFVYAVTSSIYCNIYAVIGDDCDNFQFAITVHNCCVETRVNLVILSLQYMCISYIVEIFDSSR